jgi:SAM-dependent methyltransferase
MVNFDADGGGTPGDDFKNASADICSGILKCACGAVSPVVDGVPRFVDGGVEHFPDIANYCRRQFERTGSTCENRRPPEPGNGNDDYENIRKSFSQEWGLFDYENDKTWGWTLAQRKQVFLDDVNLKSEQLSGKRLLDAGCGNGTLTAALSAFDMEVLGLDLNEGLGRAYANRGKYAKDAANRVQYVQGNLVVPPLKPGLFDLVYSSGVIHHTPSSRTAFTSLVSLTKKGGRLYIWVYGKRGWPVRVFFWLGRSLKKWMSLRSVLTVCWMLAPIYKFAAVLLNALGIMKFRPRNNREITLDLFDAFAPRYNHYHSESEVRSWFEAHGFTNIHVSGVQKHGFGMYGDKV